MLNVRVIRQTNFVTKCQIVIHTSHTYFNTYIFYWMIVWPCEPDNPSKKRKNDFRCDFFPGGGNP